MEITAQIAKNEVAARYARTEYGHYLTIDCPRGWDDVKTLVKKVLRWDGLAFTFTGWNSDRNECFFRSTGVEVIAKISTK